MTLGLNAPVARFIRSVAAAAAAAVITAVFANVEVVKEIIVDAISGIPVLQVSDPNTIAVIVWTVLAAALQAADKALRDSGSYPNYLE